MPLLFSNHRDWPALEQELRHLSRQIELVNMKANATTAAAAENTSAATSPAGGGESHVPLFALATEEAIP